MATAQRPAVEADGDSAERLEHRWQPQPGLMGSFGTVGRKQIGRRSLVTATASLPIGGDQAIVMRAHLAWPDLHVVRPTTCGAMFTLHGATMIFRYGSPILSGFANCFVPLRIGARDRWPQKAPAERIARGLLGLAQERGGRT